MSIPAIDGKLGAGSTGAVQNIPAPQRAVILKALAEVISAYVESIAKGDERLAAQNARQRRDQKRTSRKNGIQNEAVKDAERRDSIRKVSKAATRALRTTHLFSDATHYKAVHVNAAAAKG